MSVDTYLRRKNLSGYLATRHEDVRIFVTSRLVGLVRSVSIVSNRFLFWRSLRAQVALVQEHVHAGA